jgi:hypothetical protein
MNPCSIWVIVDGARTEYNMTNEETFKTLEHLEEIKYIEVKGSYLSLTPEMEKKRYTKEGEKMNCEYTIEQRKAARFIMLEKIYNEAGGTENSIFDIYEIGEELNFTTELTLTTADYLVGERLIEYKTVGGYVGITHNGIKEYEQAVKKPEQESKYFPAPNRIQYILNVEKIVNSNIQMGTTNSSQVLNVNDKYNEILAWVKKLEDEIRNNNDTELLEKLKEDIEFIKNNIATGKPDKKYIGTALNMIKSVLTGIIANAAYQGLLQILPSLIP